MKKQLVIMSGLLVYLALFYLLSTLNNKLESWASLTFNGIQADIYYRILLLIIIPIAISVISINKFIDARGINYRIFLIYLIAGITVTFVGIVGFKLPMVIRVFFIENYFMGGIIIGVGIINSLEFKNSPG